MPKLSKIDETQSANLTIAGGIGYVPITFDGLDRYDGWELSRTDGSGNEVVVDQSIHGNDFWQTDHNPTTGKWSRTYNVSLV